MTKKVLHVVNISFVLPYFIGEQFKEFSKKGYEFYVACSPSDHLFQYAQEMEFKPFELDVSRTINPVRDIIAICRLRDFIKQNGIDIVIGHTPKGGLISMIASWLAGVRNRIYFRHGIMFETSTGIKRIVLKFIEQITGKLAKTVVCVSESVVEQSEKYRLNARAKNVILFNGSCNGIDIRRFNPTNFSERDIDRIKQSYGISTGQKIVGYVGRIVRDKGIVELVDAWQLVNADQKSYKLILGGPYEERDAIPARTRQIIESDQTIIHTGLVQKSEDLYAIMDLFVLPSYREGLGMVILEASAMMLPVLTTYVTGCKNAILDGETGYFIHLEAHAFAARILSLLEDNALRKELGKKGRAFVSAAFDQQKVWNDIEEKVLRA
ncbi:MAG: glycosyltransferase family 4 protein [Mucilaginibacter polytrichastri]|nr:glycosyltransferase family 4 protein [Mucilaginibacter polytrichastri]